MTPGSTRRDQDRSAFTLIELLVVIAIIALLIGILLPSLGAAQASAKKLKCKINMRSINMAMNLYRDDHDGWGNEDKNYGARFDLNGARLEPEDEWAYWGTFYDGYINDALEIWECPEFNLMDPYPFWGTDLRFIYETQRYQSYGINALYPSISSASYDPYDPLWKTGLWGAKNAQIRGRGGVLVNTRKAYLRPLTRLARPSEMIVFQDSFEHAMETGNDALDGLTQYDSNYGGMEDFWEDAYFRHSDVCNVMFADGHLEEFDRNEVTDDGNPDLRFNYSGLPEDRPDSNDQDP